MSICFGRWQVDIFAKVPSETLLNMAAVIDHQFKKHTVHLIGHSRSTFPELSNPRMLFFASFGLCVAGKNEFAASDTI